jgi:hypothetical protein
VCFIKGRPPLLYRILACAHERTPEGRKRERGYNGHPLPQVVATAGERLLRSRGRAGVRRRPRLVLQHILQPRRLRRTIAQQKEAFTWEGRRRKKSRKGSVPSFSFPSSLSISLLAHFCPSSSPSTNSVFSPSPFLVVVLASTVAFVFVAHLRDGVVCRRRHVGPHLAGVSHSSKDKEEEEQEILPEKPSCLY